MSSQVQGLGGSLHLVGKRRVEVAHGLTTVQRAKHQVLGRGVGKAGCLGAATTTAQAQLVGLHVQVLQQANGAAAGRSDGDPCHCEASEASEIDAAHEGYVEAWNVALHVLPRGSDVGSGTLHGQLVVPVEAATHSTREHPHTHNTACHHPDTPPHVHAVTVGDDPEPDVGTHEHIAGHTLAGGEPDFVGDGAVRGCEELLLDDGLAMVRGSPEEITHHRHHLLELRHLLAEATFAHLGR